MTESKSDKYKCDQCPNEWTLLPTNEGVLIDGTVGRAVVGNVGGGSTVVGS